MSGFCCSRPQNYPRVAERPALPPIPQPIPEETDEIETSNPETVDLEDEDPDEVWPVAGCC